jgi:hypothetical protein
MHAVPVHKQNVTRGHGNRLCAIFRDKRLGDLAALPAARAVNSQSFPVASRNNL